MDFDNILEDNKLQYLSKKMPQLIKNEFSEVSYLNILDAPKVIPATFENNSSLNNGIIINGKYFLSLFSVMLINIINGINHKVRPSFNVDAVSRDWYP